MDANLNPYHQWLGLDVQLAQPNYYELLGLDPGEQDSKKIAEAADHATSKVRSCRPGPHAAQWASLLDELKSAKNCLSDAGQRAQYDAQLGEPSAATSQDNGINAATQPAPAAAMPLSNPVPPASALYPAVPASPVADASNPMDPMAPVAVGEASTQPLVAQPTATPAAAPVAATPSAIDPMAPVALANSSESGPLDSVVPLGGAATGNIASPVATAQPVGAAVAQSPEQVTLQSSPVEIGEAKSNTLQASERRNESRRTITTIAIGIGMFLLSASIIYFVINNFIGNKSGDEEDSVAQGESDPDTKSGKNNKPDAKVVEKDPITPTPSPAPTPTPMPEPKTNPTPTPMPAPMPAPTPAPMPMPMPTPTPVPAPTPAPVPVPPPKPMVTPQEVLALSQAMKAAREALASKDPEAAAKEIAKAEKLKMSDEHMAMLGRLKKVTGLVQEFWETVDKARTEMTGLDEIILPTGNIIVVVESSPELLIVKINGVSRRFTRRQESTKFAVVLADRILSQEDPYSLLVKGAAFVVEANADWHADGIQMWRDATGFSDEGTDLLTYLEDKYDFASE